MSMMMNTLLENIETKLQQIENDTNEPYFSDFGGWSCTTSSNMSLPFVKHRKLLPKNYVHNVHNWNFATYHTLETSIRHIEDP